MSTDKFELTDVASVVWLEETLRVEPDRRSSLSPSKSSAVSASETLRPSSAMKWATRIKMRKVVDLMKKNKDVLPSGVLGRFLFRLEGVRALLGLADAPSRTLFCKGR